MNDRTGPPYDVSTALFSTAFVVFVAIMIACIEQKIVSENRRRRRDERRRRNGRRRRPAQQIAEGDRLNYWFRFGFFIEF